MKKSAISLPKLKPQLASPAEEVPDDDRWLHEIKFDGYRIIAHVHDETIKLVTRNGNDSSGRFPEIRDALKTLGLRSAIFDGEVVAFNKEGVSEFQLLQTTFRRRSSAKLVYQVFDLLFLEGDDLRTLSLETRKTKAAAILRKTESPRLQYTDHLIGSGPKFFQECCKRGLEGIISTRRDRPYRSGRNRDWLKSKCVNREEFVIGGFTPSKGNKKYLGALIGGRYDDL